MTTSTAPMASEVIQPSAPKPLEQLPDDEHDERLLAYQMKNIKVPVQCAFERRRQELSDQQRWAQIGHFFGVTAYGQVEEPPGLVVLISGIELWRSHRLWSERGRRITEEWYDEIIELIPKAKTQGLSLSRSWFDQTIHQLNPANPRYDHMCTIYNELRDFFFSTVGKDARRSSQQGPCTPKELTASAAIVVAASMQQPHPGSSSSPMTLTSLPEYLVCPDCPGKSFANRKAYNRHVKGTHGPRTYYCNEPGCDKSYSRNDFLLRHQRSKHAAPGQANGGQSSPSPSQGELDASLNGSLEET